jgi:hypothetical protein
VNHGLGEFIEEFFGILLLIYVPRKIAYLLLLLEEQNFLALKQPLFTNLAQVLKRDCQYLLIVLQPCLGQYQLYSHEAHSSPQTGAGVYVHLLQIVQRLEDVVQCPLTSMIEKIYYHFQMCILFCINSILHAEYKSHLVPMGLGVDRKELIRVALIWHFASRRTGFRPFTADLRKILDLFVTVLDFAETGFNPIP